MHRGKAPHGVALSRLKHLKFDHVRTGGATPSRFIMATKHRTALAACKSWPRAQQASPAATISASMLPCLAVSPLSDLSTILPTLVTAGAPSERPHRVGGHALRHSGSAVPRPCPGTSTCPPPGQNATLFMIEGGKEDDVAVVCGLVVEDDVELSAVDEAPRHNIESVLTARERISLV